MDAGQELGPDSRIAERLEFGVLGETTARVAGATIDLGPARQRAVLAALLVDVNNPVTAEQLITRVWGVDPPLRAAGTLRSYLSRLRAALAGTDWGGIRRRGGGYVVEVDESAVDLYRFRRLAAQARANADSDVSGLFERALRFWRGDALADLDTPWSAGVRHVLDAERFAVQLDFNDGQLRRGRHAELVADLTALSSAYPLDERVAGQHIMALYCSGRQADAFTAYHRIRRRLADELGADPGPALQQRHQQILNGDLVAHTEPVDGTGEPTEPATAERSIPRQLPSDIAGFVGRAAEIEHLDDLLARFAPDRRSHSAPIISVIDGAAGIGKTALAVHWAQHAAPRFPDGQLYLNLHGYGPDTSVEPADALETLLRALDVVPELIPAGLEERSALLRSRLAPRRMLILLDNAADSDQVRPLLPGSNSLVLITSRSRLRALSARDGARHLTLDLLSTPEALRLLADAIGRDRTEREQQHAETLVRLCAHLPLALRLAAERINRFPVTPLADLVAELAEHRNRLAALSIEESPNTDLSSVFTWSYDALDPDAARMFALLGLHPGEAIHVPAAAALAALPPVHAAQLLDRLVNVSLLEQRFPGRYQLHDLIRNYAEARATEQADRGVAAERLWSYYLATARAATRRLHPEQIRLPEQPGVHDGPVEFTTAAAALDWLNAERSNLVAAVYSAGERGLPSYAGWLTDALRGYFWGRGRAVEALPLCAVAEQVAHRIGDRRAEASVVSLVGLIHFRLSEYSEARRHHERALEISKDCDDLVGQADSLHNLGRVSKQIGMRDLARQYHQQALQLAEVLGDLDAQARNANYVGSTYELEGEFDEAATWYLRATELSRRIGNYSVLTKVLGGRGNLEWFRGNLAGAIALYEENIELTGRLGDLPTEATSRIALAETLCDTGDYARAIAEADHGMAICLEIGERRHRISGMEVAATARFRSGRTEGIERVYQDALRQAREISYVYGEVSLLVALGPVYRHCARPGMAISLIETALDRMHETGTIDLESHALVQLGHAYHEDGDHRRALERSREALDMARKRGARLVEARALHLAYLLDPVHPDWCATRAHEILEQTGAAQLDILPPPA